MEEDQRTPRERSLANLRPWKPGQSGNPAGRPKTKSFETLVGEALAREIEVSVGEHGEKITAIRREVLAERVAHEAITHFAPWLIDLIMRREWPITETVQLEYPEASPDALDAALDRWLRSRGTESVPSESGNGSSLPGSTRAD